MLFHHLQLLYNVVKQWPFLRACWPAPLNQFPHTWRIGHGSHIQPAIFLCCKLCGIIGCLLFERRSTLKHLIQNHVKWEHIHTLIVLFIQKNLRHHVPVAPHLPCQLAHSMHMIHINQLVQPKVLNWELTGFIKKEGSWIRSRWMMEFGPLCR